MASAVGAQSPAPGIKVARAPAAHARRSACVCSGKPFRRKNSGEDVACTRGVDRFDGGRGHVHAASVVKVADAERPARRHQMRYRPMPFARFVIVHHDDVGDAGQRREVVGAAHGPATR